MLGLMYTYIDKLEKMGCACSAYKYRDFIKSWSLIALVVVLVMMFAPLGFVQKFHDGLGRAYVAMYFAFLIVHLVYIVLALKYLDHMIREKCKCSEDIRRELLYLWNILRAVVIFSGLIFAVIVPIGLTSVATLNSQGKNILNDTMNPVSGLRKIPKSLKKSLKKFK
jgi:ABC-type proline/glycine betaine transport system permease subunit